MNVKFYVDLKKYRKDIIDAFVEEYGEKYRDIITKRYDEVDIYHFIEPNGLMKTYQEETNRLKVLKKKLKNSKNMEGLEQKIESLEKELKNLKQYLYYHDLVKKHVFHRHINGFVDKYQNYLTKEDQQSWKEKHDILFLEHLEVILNVTLVHYDQLHLYYVHLYDMTGYSDFLSAGLLEFFKFGVVSEVSSEQNRFNEIYYMQQEYYRLMGDVEIPFSILEQLELDRENLIEQLLLDYQTHFLGYAYYYAKQENKNDYFDNRLVLKTIGESAYYIPTACKKKKKFVYAPYISFNPALGASHTMDQIFIHELTHAINAYPIKISNHLKVASGFVVLEYWKDKKKQKSLHQEEEYLDEILNDYIASKITKRLHEKGIYIWQKETEPSIFKKQQKLYPYSELFHFIKPLWENYKESILDYFMNGNRDQFMKQLPCDFSMLSLVARQLWSERYAIYQYSFKNTTSSYHKINTLNKKLKKSIEEYHKELGI